MCIRDRLKGGKQRRWRKSLANLHLWLAKSEMGGVSLHWQPGARYLISYQLNLSIKNTINKSMKWKRESRMTRRVGQSTKHARRHSDLKPTAQNPGKSSHLFNRRKLSSQRLHHQCLVVLALRSLMVATRVDPYLGCQTTKPTFFREKACSSRWN